MGALLDVAADQTAFIKHEGLDANSLLVGGTVHAFFITHCEGEALSLVSLVLGHFGLEAWRVLKDEYEEKGGNPMAALLRSILHPRARWKKVYSEGRDLGDMPASWEKDVAQCRIVASADLQQAIQVATVMEHAPAAYRDFLKVVPSANRETYHTLRASSARDRHWHREPFTTLGGTCLMTHQHQTDIGEGKKGK